MATAKKGENALEDVALVPGTQQNLSNLYSLDIYAKVPQTGPRLIAIQSYKLFFNFFSITSSAKSFFMLNVKVTFTFDWSKVRARPTISWNSW
jgi:hypothetical protein